MEQLNPLQFIRIKVFGKTQSGFARCLGVLQSQVSKWEARGHCSYDQQQAIRKAAKKLKLDWSDSYFFEVPRHAKRKKAKADRAGSGQALQPAHQGQG